MKKTILTLAAIIVLSLSGISQELNTTARSIKDKYPVLYQSIKTFAVDKWQDDHEMVVHVINKQSLGYLDAIGLFADNPGEEMLFYKAVLKWSVEGKEDYNFSILKTSASFDDLRVDWEMIAYTLKKQLQAKNAY